MTNDQKIIGHRALKIGILQRVGRAGFEPTKGDPADLQSAPFDRFGICPV